MNALKSEGTLVKPRFEHSLIHHQLGKAFHLMPSGAGVRILDDEVSAASELLPSESHSKLNQNPRFGTESSNIGISVEV